MRRYCLSTFCLALAVHPPAPSAAQATGVAQSLHVIVRDGYGPLADALIELRYAGRRLELPASTARTGRDGRATIIVTTRPAELIVRRLGYIPDTLRLGLAELPTDSVVVPLSRGASASFMAHLAQARRRELDSLRNLRGEWRCVTDAAYLEAERETWVKELIGGQTRIILEKRGLRVPRDPTAAAAALRTVADHRVCRAAGDAHDQLDGINSTAFAVFYYRGYALVRFGGGYAIFEGRWRKVESWFYAEM